MVSQEHKIQEHPFLGKEGRFLSPPVMFLFVVPAMLDEDEDDRVDEIALRQLTEMGFPENRAIKALRLNQ